MRSLLGMVVITQTRGSGTVFTHRVCPARSMAARGVLQPSAGAQSVTSAAACRDLQMVFAFSHLTGLIWST